MNWKKRHIILGSKSPRRKQLFEQAGFDFEVKAKETNEVLNPLETVEQNTMRLAKEKAMALGLRELVVCGDTLVSLDDKHVLGKPSDKQQAIEMLKSISGRSHYVTTGVCISKNQEYYCFYEQTKVFIKPVSDEMVHYYIDQYKVLDKAGSYGIQDWFGLTQVEKIEGCFYNVMGFPMPRFFQELNKIIS